MSKLYSMTFLLAMIAFLAMGQVNINWVATYSNTPQLFDYGREVKTDASGNVYVGGHTKYTTQGDAMISVIKFDVNGTKVWENHGALATDILEDMTIDDQGNVYYTGSRWVPATAESNYLTVKLDSSGTELWSKEYDGNGIGSGSDYAWGMFVDAQYNVYVTGHSQGNLNGYDLVTVKYDSSGNELWAARYDSVNVNMNPTYFNDAFEVEADTDGDVYVSGYTYNGSTYDLTLLKYDKDGWLKWITDFNTKCDFPTTNINRNYMKLDADENIYLLGRTQDSLTGADMLLLKYDTSGTLVWNRTWNSPTNDSDVVSGGFYDDEALQIDQNGNVFISGSITNKNISFMEDIVTVKYDSQGNKLWQDIFNGSGNDYDLPYGLALDAAGNAYVCGITSYNSNIGSVDYITYKLNALTGAHEWDQTYNGSGGFYDEAHAITVDASNNVYVTGWSATNQDAFNLTAQMVTIKYSQGANGVTENHPAAGINLFPNPASDIVMIQPGKGFSDHYELTVYDVPGKLVWNGKGLSGNTKLDIHSWPDGIYFVNAISPAGTVKEKIVISH